MIQLCRLLLALALTCMEEEMLSLSLRISWRFFVPKMFLSVVWARSLSTEVRSRPTRVGNSTRQKSELTLWNGGRFPRWPPTPWRWTPCNRRRHRPRPSLSLWSTPERKDGWMATRPDILSAISAYFLWWHPQGDGSQVHLLI